MTHAQTTQTTPPPPPTMTTTTLKVIGLGLSRTGTLSLQKALDLLGFGPCHHPISMKEEESDWLSRWAKVYKEGAPPELLADLYRGYASAVDGTAALLAEPLYNAFPNAKFILTIREPADWARSVQNTLNHLEDTIDGIRQKILSGTTTETDRNIYERRRTQEVAAWVQVHQNEHHKGRLKTDPEGEFIRHNEYIKNLIPKDQLLVFNVAEGWKPLVDFLGVPEPNQPFPRTNDTVQFTEMLKNSGLVIKDP